MKLRLEEVQPGKKLRREVEWKREECSTVTGHATLLNVMGYLDFAIDPMGYLVHYDLKAQAEMPCIRCGQTVTSEISHTDWVSLRTQQPEDAHLVLADTEMNVRFLDESVLDLKKFVFEIFELELPAYPRHDEDDASCAGSLDVVDSEENASPFDVLSKFLD